MCLLRLTGLHSDIQKYSHRCEVTWNNIDRVLIRVQWKEIMCNYPLIYRSSVSWSSLFSVCKYNRSRFSAYKPVKKQEIFYVEKCNRSNLKRVGIKEKCDKNWKFRKIPNFVKGNLNMEIFEYFKFLRNYLIEVLKLNRAN